jgi:hypothetical protein
MKLKYEPRPENAPRFAADVVEAARMVNSVELDYSVASIEQVDAIIEGMRQEGHTPETMAESLYSFGCYLGEVLVRQAGGQWREATKAELPTLAGLLPLVQLATGGACNPIGKVFKRLQNGPAENLVAFYQACTGSK